jgi:hypothetical protein
MYATSTFSAQKLVKPIVRRVIKPPRMTESMKEFGMLPEFESPVPDHIKYNISMASKIKEKQQYVEKFKRSILNKHNPAVMANI